MGSNRHNKHDKRNEKKLLKFLKQENGSNVKPGKNAYGKPGRKP